MKQKKRLTKNFFLSLSIYIQSIYPTQDGGIPSSTPSLRRNLWTFPQLHFISVISPSQSAPVSLHSSSKNGAVPFIPHGRATMSDSIYTVIVAGVLAMALPLLLQSVN